MPAVKDVVKLLLDVGGDGVPLMVDPELAHRHVVPQRPHQRQQPSFTQVVTLDRQLDQPYRAAHNIPEHLPGGVVEGNVCWTVGSADQDDLTMIVEVFFDDATAYVDLTG